MAVTVPYSNLWAEISQVTEGDPRLGPILLNIRRGELLEGEFNMRGGCLVRTSRVVVPDTLELKRKILHEFHDSVIRGHLRILRTYKRIGQLFSWPGMKTDVVHYVQECYMCQRNKSDSRRPAGLLEPLPIPNKLFKLHGTKLKMSSAYHPQTDCQMEVINRCLEQYLHCFVYHQPRLWERYLAWAEYWYNTTYQRSISTTPFEVVYGRPASVLVGYEPGFTAFNEVEKQLRARDAILRELKSNLAAAQNRMKAAADKHRRDEQFEVGDWVYLKLQPYRQHSVFKRAIQKLTSRYFGPFQVIARVGAAAYRLDLPDYAKIHPMFHVSLLRRRVGEGQAIQPTLPPYVAHSGVRTCEALVRWNALPDEDATWESVEVLKLHFPTLNLEDRFDLRGEELMGPAQHRRNLGALLSSDTMLNLRVYTGD
ncbi:hypothetical protein CRG98_040552 [Punica granatum]|uniref:Uncharacterized protein n=1 Tax=Punica granatum TaxID=22663 RepID=A0A2I0I4X7_PUNGR|nr:hypothetical protein CRG98_040552 [Punica granatum]